MKEPNPEGRRRPHMRPQQAGQPGAVHHQTPPLTRVAVMYTPCVSVAYRRVPSVLSIHTQYDVMAARHRGGGSWSSHPSGIFYRARLRAGQAAQRCCEQSMAGALCDSHAPRLLGTAALLLGTVTLTEMVLSAAL